MEFNKFLEQLNSKKIEFLLKEPMKSHTTFKIGGEADVFVKVKNSQELSAVLKAADQSNVPCFILGKGSNLLVSDRGIEGAVISLSGLDSIKITGDIITCGAGAMLSKVCTAAMENSLSGLEFAYGIPGSVGGAIYMNAGAYGGEISQVVKSAVCLDKKGNKVTLNSEDMKLGYRTSAFKNNELIIVEATLCLNTGKKEEIEKQMKDFLSRRKEKQPLEYPSAGSTFKRPQGNFAGALIEKNSLKGFKIGDAQVSEKHAGFVINKGNAKCEDVLKLIDKIKETVYTNDGVNLETEVIFVGRA